MFQIALGICVGNRFHFLFFAVTFSCQDRRFWIFLSEDTVE